MYGATWAAALIAAAFTAPTVRHAVDQALAVIPASSRLARTVRRVVSLHDTRMTWEDTLTTVAEETAGLGWIHTIPNAAVLTAGLLYGDGDFTRTITLTVRGGLDTDSNGATAGSVAGVLTGADAIPTQWKEPLEDTVRSAVSGFDGVRISELAQRTVQLAATEIQPTGATPRPSSALAVFMARGLSGDQRCRASWLPFLDDLHA